MTPAPTRRSIARLAGVVLLGLAATGAARAQATIGDCEKIQAADAYNQCLAKFGPVSKSGDLAPERPGDIKGSSEEAAASAGRPKGAAARSAGARGAGTRSAARHGRRGHGRAVRHGGGRKRMTFTIHRRHR